MVEEGSFSRGKSAREMGTYGREWKREKQVKERDVWEMKGVLNG